MFLPETWPSNGMELCFIVCCSCFMFGFCALNIHSKLISLFDFISSFPLLELLFIVFFGTFYWVFHYIYGSAFMKTVLNILFSIKENARIKFNKNWNKILCKKGNEASNVYVHSLLLEQRFFAFSSSLLSRYHFHLIHLTYW